jgi:endonuclease-3 related protein
MKKNYDILAPGARNGMGISQMLRKKVTDLDNRLLEIYGNQGWWPTSFEQGGVPVYYPGKEGRIVSDDEAVEIIVGSILTQNTSWRNAEQAIINLTAKHLLNLPSIAEGKNDLKEAIKPARFYNQKSLRLQAIANRIIRAGGVRALRNCPTGQLRNLLLSWTGIGPETADSILCYAFNRPIFVVDAYTQRLFEKMDIPFRSYEEMQRLVHQSIQPSAARYGDFHARIVNLFARKELDLFLTECQGKNL